MKYLLSILMVLTSVLFGVRLYNDIPDNKKNEYDNSNNRHHDIVQFTLKYENGIITLFDGDIIIDTFSEVNFSTLPPADRESLSNGIILENIEDAYSLIEDFDG